MITTAIRHSVTDYAKWKTVYDTFRPTSEGGAKFARVNRSVEDPNMVTVVAGFDTLELAKAFVDNPSLKAKMTEAGIVGTPRIEINEEVESI
ncbi:MAG TPA: cyclase [Acidimicrobiia bacterium]|nr:cyclase [Acidimicrobiia bacterium]